MYATVQHVCDPVKNKHMKINVIIIIIKKHTNIYIFKIRNSRSRFILSGMTGNCLLYSPVIFSFYHPQRRPLPLLTYNAEAVFSVYMTQI